jgi:hypothetical protein
MWPLPPSDLAAPISCWAVTFLDVTPGGGFQPALISASQADDEPITYALPSTMIVLSEAVPWDRSAPEPVILRMISPAGQRRRDLVGEQQLERLLPAAERAGDLVGGVHELARHLDARLDVVLQPLLRGESCSRRSPTCRPGRRDGRTPAAAA